MQYKVFGCKVNKYYTDKWLNSEYLSDKTGIFVASCVVTDNAKRKWIRFVKKELLSLSWKQKVYISGCWAFKDGKAQSDFFEIYPELRDFQEKIEILEEDPPKLWKKEKKVFKNKIDLSKFQTAQKTQMYTKKFVLIQWGCDSFCTFCLTVQKRGRHYYRAAEDIIEEIQEFEKKWGKEVVLTGVNLSAWGLESTNDTHKSRFAELLQNILNKTSIPRLRISSLWPEFINDDVLKVLWEERIYPHFHFSIQSGSSNILQSMARHYDGIYMRKLLGKTRNIIRKDGVSISIWADIIVGFPGETEKDFMETYKLIRDYKITKVHAFPFSAHTMGESVPAGKFKNQVPENIKKERMQKITDLAENIRKEFKKSQKWKTLKVLIEKIDNVSWSGWTENYLEADKWNFEVISWELKRNNIIIWKFK